MTDQTAPTPVQSADAYFDGGSARHLVTMYANRDSEFKMTCHSAPGASCRAVWDCGCEGWWRYEVVDGKPTHATAPVEGDAEIHTGRFDPAVCQICVWFNEGDGPSDMSGEVTFEVDPQWQGEFFTYVIDPTHPNEKRRHLMAQQKNRVEEFIKEREAEERTVASMIDSNEVKNRFGFHKATIEGENATAPQHANMRKQYVDFALWLNAVLPDVPERDHAFKALQEASMWSHVAVSKQAPLIDE